MKGASPSPPPPPPLLSRLHYAGSPMYHDAFESNSINGIQRHTYKYAGIVVWKPFLCIIKRNHLTITGFLHE